MNIEQQQFIAPGEFTFCARCGSVCHVGKQSFSCKSCRASGKSASSCPNKNCQEAEQKALLEAQEEEAETSAGLQELRCKLAEARKAAGMKPLFWMED